ncbi:hypothetical protein H4R34_001407 [Dimargaris verticillata]|uniref:Uncharacterized protein n=1 Tax=Dimargaris verticillata TaxID=2761393 RepID=A0A9W8EAB3_9FUNG|nr:hypothetical protein H4R34_001407 [Dimargaris verticillata]
MAHNQTNQVPLGHSPAYDYLSMTMNLDERRQESALPPAARSASATTDHVSVPVEDQHHSTSQTATAMPRAAITYHHARQLAVPKYQRHNRNCECRGSGVGCQCGAICECR